MNLREYWEKGEVTLGNDFMLGQALENQGIFKRLELNPVDWILLLCYGIIEPEFDSYAGSDGTDFNILVSVTRPVEYSTAGEIMDNIDEMLIRSSFTSCYTEYNRAMFMVALTTKRFSSSMIDITMSDCSDVLPVLCMKTEEEFLRSRDTNVFGHALELDVDLRTYWNGWVKIDPYAEDTINEQPDSISYDEAISFFKDVPKKIIYASLLEGYKPALMRFVFVSN